MSSLFQRMLPKSLRSSPAANDVAAPARTSQATAAPDSDAPSRRASMTARRPLISRDGEVAGFEFRLDDATLQRLRQGASSDEIAAHVAAVLVAARLVALGGRIGFARLPTAWLAHAAVPRDESGMFIGLEPFPGEHPDTEAGQAVAQAVIQFQLAGAKIACGPVFAGDVSPDAALLLQAQAPLDSLLGAMAALPAPLQGKPLIVTDVANVDDLERILQGGASFVSGALAAQTAAPPIKDTLPLPPELGRVSQLLQKLTGEADNAVIIGDLKGDIGLSVRLLQRINSASFAHLGGVASIDQAVMVLGRNELHRWLSMMLMQFASKRKVSSALQEVTLWRARFVELLATEKGATEPGQFFTLGLASLLGLLLKVSTIEVVTLLGLPEAAEQALISQAGPWYLYLRVAMQVEAQSLSDDMAKAEGFSSSERVLQLSEEAWTWAAQHTQKLPT